MVEFLCNIPPKSYAFYRKMSNFKQLVSCVYSYYNATYRFLKQLLYTRISSPCRRHDELRSGSLRNPRRFKTCLQRLSGVAVDDNAASYLTLSSQS